MTAIIRVASGINLNALQRQPGGEIRYNENGTVSAFETFKCRYSVAINQAPRRNVSVHPLFSSLYCVNAIVKEIPGDLAEIAVEYLGDPAGDSLLNGGVAPTPRYQLVVDGREEPIETFKDFTTTIGTTAKGAKFDGNGLFLGYDKTSAFAGITSYLVPAVTWRESGFTAQVPSAASVNRVGHIDSPTGPVPQAATGRNWLLRSFTYEQQGKIFPYVKEWALSGPRGWNTEIYG